MRRRRVAWANIASLPEVGQACRDLEKRISELHFEKEILVVKNDALQKDTDKAEDMYVELGKSHSWLKNELRSCEERVREQGPSSLFPMGKLPSSLLSYQ